MRGQTNGGCGADDEGTEDEGEPSGPQLGQPGRAQMLERRLVWLGVVPSRASTPERLQSSWVHGAPVSKVAADS